MRADPRETSTPAYTLIWGATLGAYHDWSVDDAPSSPVVAAAAAAPAVVAAAAAVVEVVVGVVAPSILQNPLYQL